MNQPILAAGTCLLALSLSAPQAFAQEAAEEADYVNYTIDEFLDDSCRVTAAAVLASDELGFDQYYERMRLAAHLAMPEAQRAFMRLKSVLEENKDSLVGCWRRIYGNGEGGCNEYEVVREVVRPLREELGPHFTFGNESGFGERIDGAYQGEWKFTACRRTSLGVRACNEIDLFDLDSPAEEWIEDEVTPDHSENDGGVFLVARSYSTPRLSYPLTREDAAKLFFEGAIFDGQISRAHGVCIEHLEHEDYRIALEDLNHRRAEPGRAPADPAPALEADSRAPAAGESALP